MGTAAWPDYIERWLIFSSLEHGADLLGEIFPGVGLGEKLDARVEAAVVDELLTGTGSEVQCPLAVVVIGGPVTSTILTLLVDPAIYRWFAPPVRSTS